MARVVQVHNIEISEMESDEKDGEDRRCSIGTAILMQRPAENGRKHIPIRRQGKMCRKDRHCPQRQGGGAKAATR